MNQDAKKTPPCLLALTSLSALEQCPVCKHYAGNHAAWQREISRGLKRPTPGVLSTIVQHVNVDPAATLKAKRYATWAAPPLDLETDRKISAKLHASMATRDRPRLELRPGEAPRVVSPVGQTVKTPPRISQTPRSADPSPPTQNHAGGDSRLLDGRVVGSRRETIRDVVMDIGALFRDAVRDFDLADFKRRRRERKRKR